MTWRMYRNALDAQRPHTDPAFREAAGYLPAPDLVNAVDVALTLGQPLLLTGEPGTGKTQLAHSVAYQLLGQAPITFNTKTTSTARDLFYHYDALRDFRDSQKPAQGTRATTPADYVTFEALGLAILRAQPPGSANALLPERFHNMGQGRSVVLIDEIDKAPKDLPNDVLNEIERMEFNIAEMGSSSRFSVKDPAFRPIVILTSNSEKFLPDAFLRRCVYYDLPFPEFDALQKIVSARLGEDTARTPWVGEAIRTFEAIRNLPLKKKPATAELLAWLTILQRLAAEQTDGNPMSHAMYASTIATIMKDKDSAAAARKAMKL